MPIYEFECAACGCAFEALVPRIDARVPCSACGSEQVEKQLSLFTPSVSSNPPSPCSSGECPSAGRAGSGCSTGACPLT